MWIFLLILILATILVAMLWLYYKQERNWQEELANYRKRRRTASKKDRVPAEPLPEEAVSIGVSGRLPENKLPVRTVKAAPAADARTDKKTSTLPLPVTRRAAEAVSGSREELAAPPAEVTENTVVPEWEHGLTALNQAERLPVYPNRSPAPKPLEHLSHSNRDTDGQPEKTDAEAAKPRGFTFELLEPEHKEPPEIITLEEATRNLNSNGTAAEAPAVPEAETPAQPREDLEVITLEEALRGFQAEAAAKEQEGPAPVPRVLDGEEIGLDEIMNSVRERTLSALNPPAPVQQQQTTTEEMETIGMDEIRASLLRQRQAARHHQQMLTETPAGSLNVIDEDEVIANLAHTDSPISRRLRQQQAQQRGKRGAAPAYGVHQAPVHDSLRNSKPKQPKPVRNKNLRSRTAVSLPQEHGSSEPVQDDAPETHPEPSSGSLKTPLTPIYSGFTVPAPPPPVPALEVEIEAPPIFEQPVFPKKPAYAETETEADTDWASFAEGLDAAADDLAAAEDFEWEDAGALPAYPLPTPALLLPAQYDIDAVQTDEQLLENGITIEEKLAEFRVKVKVIDAYAGPVITRYEIEPDVGVRGSSVMNLEKDLARSLGMASIRVLETIPGKNCMGIELPNPQRQMIRLSEVLSAPEFTGSRSKLTLALGQDITGEPVVTDLATAPHLLVAGTTGSGKSVGINSMILSMLFKATPEDVRLIMIDPKMLELSVYEGIPHLLAPVVTDMKLAANALAWCVGEMEKRYRLMSHVGVRNLSGYNAKIAEAAAHGERIGNPFSFTPDDPEPLEKLPFIVVVVDEFADLMMTAGKKIEELIARLAQKARAAGIHLILATQRPSVDVITGLIKANIPTRIAFQVPSKTDSRTILDQMGAENLLGQGDMLFLRAGSSHLSRIHGAFVADSEVHAVVEYLKQFGEPDYVEDILMPESEDYSFSGIGGGERDPLFDKAVEAVLRSNKPTISSLQRHLRIGYNKAATLMDQMEAEGIVSAADHTGKRTVLARGGSDNAV